MKRYASRVLVTLALAACQDAPTSTPAAAAIPGARPPSAPVLGRAASRQAIPGEAIPGRYVVLLRAGHSAAANANAMAAREHGRVRHVYRVINGFAIDVADTSVIELARDAKVAAILPDQVVAVAASGVETSAPWGLDRLDQRALPLNGSFAYGTDGRGVTVYIVDTGINYGHVDFGGRATAGYDAVAVGGAVDCHGHGTHVAGTVGGTRYGVAKAASLVGVRVFDCAGNGSASGVIAGLDWVLKQKQASASRPMVVNMSLVGGAYAPLDSAVARLTSAGVTVAVAAGNATVDACTQSPARVASAITVGATGANDALASFSNYGACVDLSAPGVSITSDAHSSATGTAVMSGTSMATPHVAGAAALYLAANPTATAAQVASALVANATPNVVTALPAATPNRLLYVGFLSGAVTPPGNRAPTVSIASPVAGASIVQGTSVSFAGSASDPESGALSGASLVWTSSINGQIGTGPSFATASLWVGTHTITLTAKDPQGATGSATRTITVTPASTTTANQPPVAAFTWTCVGLNPHQCAFDAARSTDDRGIVSYAWTWGNGSGETKTVPTTKKTWLAAGTYTVTLTVSDAAGLTSAVSRLVAVP